MLKGRWKIKGGGDIREGVCLAGVHLGPPLAPHVISLSPIRSDLRSTEPRVKALRIDECDPSSPFPLHPYPCKEKNLACRKPSLFCFAFLYFMLLIWDPHTEMLRGYPWLRMTLARIRGTLY